MSRGRLAYLVPLALLLVGSIIAHTLAYRLVDPGGRLLGSTGHGYLDVLPLVLGAALAFVLLGLAGEALRAFRGHRQQGPPRLQLALLPIVGFALQEHLERYLHTGEWPLTAALEPTFLVGLALQLPLTAAALLAARALLGTARRAGEALADGPVRPRLASRLAFVLAPRAFAPPAAPALRASPSRGPPEVS